MHKHHGMARTPTYRSWISMRTRCFNPRRACFKHYGGRGITVCSRWESFTAFFEDMGERPAGKSIGRINNDGNYEPGNCRWEDAFEQARNTSIVRKATIDGQEISLPEIAESLGIPMTALHSRVARYGIDEAVSSSMAKPGLFRLRTSPPGVWAKDGDDQPYIGTRWSSLTIIERVSVNSRGRVFRCVCDCGGIRETNLGFLVTGSTVSCGCTTRAKASAHARHLNAERMSR